MCTKIVASLFQTFNDLLLVEKDKSVHGNNILNPIHLQKEKDQGRPQKAKYQNLKNYKNTKEIKLQISKWTKKDLNKTVFRKRNTKDNNYF